MGIYLRAEISDNINNEEDGTFFGSHGEIATSSVSLNWVIGGSFNEEVKNLGG